MSGKKFNCTRLTDKVCRQCLGVFKVFDPNAFIFPGIGLPSQNNGVCTISHTIPGMPNMRINRLESKSPLANNALFSTECTGGTSLNLYEIMLPEGLSKVPGKRSAAEAYAKELSDLGIDVAGNHWHWWASTPFHYAIHSQSAGMNPIDFVAKTVRALFNFKRRFRESGK